jgi:signal transduction histidine kinase
MNLISNPRFGVDQSVASILKKLHAFFRADVCMLILHDTDADIYCVRQIDTADVDHALHAKPLPADMARPLLPFQCDRLVLFGRKQMFRRGGRYECQLYADNAKQWATALDVHGEQVAELLSMDTYIGAPVNWRKYVGRLYVAANRGAYSQDDALFLLQAVEQAFRLIEHIDVLDRLASGAAQKERQRIVGDFHDSAIQPYIGLKMALEALREQAQPDNPLVAQIGKLIRMTTHTLSEMRQYVSHLEDYQAAPASVLVNDIRQLAARFQEFYGIHIDVQFEGNVHFNDRLAAEVRQIVHEGLSNIRKHTTAQQGRILIACATDMLRLEICNADDRAPARPFTPRSIVTRVESLGGRVRVTRELGRPTIISINIPI